MVRVGVVGAGYWGKNLVRCFAELGALAAVCDRDVNVLKNAGVRYPGVQCFDSVDEMLREGNMEAVVIATPAATHYAIARRVLEAGCHVMVEKPFTGDPQLARELVDLAEAKGLVLMVGFTFLYNNAVHHVKRSLDQGEIGKLHYAFSQRLNLGRVQSDVNVWWNLAPHDVSIILYLFGAFPVEVSGWGVSCLQPGIEDVAMARLSFEDGRVAYIHVSWLDPNKVRSTTLVGSSKMIIYDDVNPDRKVEVYDQGIDFLPPDGTLGQFATFGQFQLIHRSGDIHVPKLSLEEPLLVESRHFLESIEGDVPCHTSGRMALDVVQVLDAVQHSIRDAGRPVQMAGARML